MATKKRKVGDETPTKSSYVTTVTDILERVKKEDSSGLNKLKVKALKIFLSVCELENKKKDADNKFSSL